LYAVEQDVARRLARATFDAYRHIVDLCIREGVDALLVAGDVFDGADRSLAAQLKFVEGLQRLDQAGIRSFVCHGNHDSLDGWEARLAFPTSCHRFGPDVERVPVFPEEPNRVAVYGASYPRREVRENLVPGFQRSGAEQFAIGLLHANVGENTGHEPYAPCTLDDLAGSGFDYWALGHVHTRQVLRELAPVVVYPGNPQGRHPNERGARGVYLVEVSDSGLVKLGFHPVDVVRWESIAVNIEDLEDEQSLPDIISEQIDNLRDNAEGRDLILRVSLIGRGPLHASLLRPGVVGDIRSQINEKWVRQNPFVFCERLTDESASPIIREERSQGEDFVGELLRLVDSLHHSPDELNKLAAELDALYRNQRLARYFRDAAPSRDDVVELLAEAESLCLDKLVEGAGS
jgi:DNA repair exonuclease SbcCD nuclease subunit